MNQFHSAHPRVDEIMNGPATGGKFPSGDDIAALSVEHPAIQRSIELAQAAGADEIEALRLAVKALATLSSELHSENRRLKASMRTRMIGPGIHKMTPGPGPEEVV